MEGVLKEVNSNINYYEKYLEEFKVIKDLCSSEKSYLTIINESKNKIDNIIQKVNDSSSNKTSILVISKQILEIIGICDILNKYGDFVLTSNLKEIKYNNFDLEVDGNKFNLKNALDELKIKSEELMGHVVDLQMKEYVIESLSKLYESVKNKQSDITNYKLASDCVIKTTDSMLDLAKRQIKEILIGSINYNDNYSESSKKIMFYII